MVSVLLNILKIIGIILLVLIGIVLLLILAVLFAPIHYRASGHYRNTSDFEAKLKLHWLLHLINVRLEFDKTNNFKGVVRICGIPVYDSDKKKESEDNEKNDISVIENIDLKNSKVNEDEETVPNDINTIENDTLDIEKNSPDIEKQQEIRQQDDNSNINIKRNADEALRKKNIKRHRVKEFIAKLKSTANKIRYTFRHLYDIIKSVIENINYYYELFQNDNTKSVVGKCKKQIRKIYKNLKPGYVNINIHIGREDPAQLGSIMGIWGMLYPFHLGNIQLDTEFDRDIFEADFRIKGYLTGFVLWQTWLIYLFDKDIKELKRCLKREED